eukprot:551532_1
MNNALNKHNQIEYENVHHMSNKQLLDHILEINDKYLNIPQLLDSNNFINSPNKEAIMTYILLLKSAIENKNIFNNMNNNINAPDTYIEDIKDNNNNNNNVDVAILCDITDSMKPWIDEIKNGIVRIINQLKNTYGIGKLR